MERWSIRYENLRQIKNLRPIPHEQHPQLNKSNVINLPSQYHKILRNNIYKLINKYNNVTGRK